MARHPTERELHRLTLKQVAASIGRSERETKKLLAKLGFLPSAHRRDGKYDRRLLTALRPMLGQPVESTPAEADWLTQYLSQEDPHA